MNEWMVFMNRKSLPSFTTQNVKVRESNQNQVKLCFRMFLVKIKDQRICFQGFQQNLSAAQTPHWKCANNLDECFINFEWRIRNDKKYSASTCTFLIVLSISMSPTGIRIPPNRATTAPMTAPVTSPQCRSQPMFLAGKF